jgi:hypothetical protein
MRKTPSEKCATFDKLIVLYIVDQQLSEIYMYIKRLCLMWISNEILVLGV